MIPVSVIVTTKNEEKNIGACLETLTGFSQIIVVDSESRDRTVEIARNYGAEIVPFKWNGQYPKKRQWCLDHLKINHDWILFVDADELVTNELKAEINDILSAKFSCAAYFVKGHHLIHGKVLKYGMQNNKIVFFDRRCVEFPVVDDLDIPGMGEMEGHHQPVLKSGQGQIGQLASPMLHKSLEDERGWIFRHEKYARWEAGMNARNGWPKDPVPSRDKLKKWLRSTRLRPQIIFFLSYVVLGGFLDGKDGLKYSLQKKSYYRLIANLRN